jgi:hypothetical protein
MVGRIDLSTIDECVALLQTGKRAVLTVGSFPN